VPDFMALTDIGTSACAVRKTIEILLSSFFQLVLKGRC
jgi:hypothetical protein